MVPVTDPDILGSVNEGFENDGNYDELGFENGANYDEFDVGEFDSSGSEHGDSC